MTRTSTGSTSVDGGQDGVSLPSSKIISKKPKYTKFSQQELSACKPILTPGWVISAFIAIGVFFIPIGLASLAASEKVVEIIYRYDDYCVPGHFSKDKVGYIQRSDTNKTCTINLNVTKPMKSPVYIYYQLENFHQNHRRYVKSRSDKQLRSKAYENEIKACKPEDTANQKPIVPCGLIAWSLFNDTYKFSVNNTELNVSKKNIAWKSDSQHKFGSDVYPKNFQRGDEIGGGTLNESIPLSEQDDLIVWMRTAALPTFRKLYGRIEKDLRANDSVTVVIQNNYNTYTFSGKKRLVLSTTTWLGGKNNFMGTAYIGIGGLSLLMAIGFMLAYVIKPRPLGDPSYLSWNRNPAAMHSN